MQNSLSQLRRMNSSYMGADFDAAEQQDDNHNQSLLQGRSLKSIRRIRQELQDQDLLHRTLQDACQFAYGTQMVEVWVWDEVHSVLRRPEGGWWIDPYWQFDTAVFCQFVDAKSHDYIAPPALAPGVGIPGVLWSDLRGHSSRSSTAGALSGHNRRKSRLSSGGGGAGSGILGDTFLAQIFSDDHHNNHPNGNGNNNYFAQHERIAWRDLKALANDPDQPPNRRLQVLASSTDLKWTGGVPFCNHGQEGIVVYYARETTNLHKLQDPTNTTYLMTASDFVGSCLALRIPRRNAIARRQHTVDRNLRKVKYTLLFLIRQGADLESIAQGKFDWNTQQQQQAQTQTTSDQNKNDAVKLVQSAESVVETCTGNTMQLLKRKAQQSMTKFKGAAYHAPPTFTWEMSWFTCLGVLFSIVSVSILNQVFTRIGGTAWQVPMGPMGALLALQFGLTAAPAAQPRMIFQGQVVSITIALLWSQWDTPHGWIPQSIACAMAIGTMTKLGVVNPPAAANAFVFAAPGKWGLGNMVATLCANGLAILCSVVINNLSDNRQYPTSWGIPQILLSQAMLQHQRELQDRDDTVTILLRRARKLRRKASRGRGGGRSGNSSSGSSWSGGDTDEDDDLVNTTTTTAARNRDKDKPPYEPPDSGHQNSIIDIHQHHKQGVEDNNDDDDDDNSIHLTPTEDDVEMANNGSQEPTVRFAGDNGANSIIISMDGASTDVAASSSRPTGRHRRSPAATSNMFI